MRFGLKSALFLCAVIYILVSPVTVLCQQEFSFQAEVNSANINLRSDSTASSGIIAVLNKGERLEVMLESYGWYKVRLPQRIPVFIKAGLVECIMPEQGVSGNPTCLSAKVLRDRVNIRASASEGAAIVGVADKNEVINVLGEAGGWFRIEPTRNSFGWVHAKFLSKAQVPAEGPAKKETAQPKEEPGNITLRGTVNPYGMVLWRVATHKLITAQNKIYLLKGNRQSMNALNRRKAKVIGKVISKPGAKYPVVEVMIIEVDN
jgi:uncharacterized protein YgiM (DUF1202 family)